MRSTRAWSAPYTERISEERDRKARNVLEMQIRLTDALVESQQLFLSIAAVDVGGQIVGADFWRSQQGKADKNAVFRRRFGDDAGISWAYADLAQQNVARLWATPPDEVLMLCLRDVFIACGKVKKVFLHIDSRQKGDALRLVLRRVVRAVCDEVA